MKKIILLGSTLSIVTLALVAISASCDGKKIDVKNTKVQKHILKNCMNIKKNSKN